MAYLTDEDSINRSAWEMYKAISIMLALGEGGITEETCAGVATAAYMASAEFEKYRRSGAGLTYWEEE
jgi:hypothetical protein